MEFEYDELRSWLSDNSLQQLYPILSTICTDVDDLYRLIESLQFNTDRLCEELSLDRSESIELVNKLQSDNSAIKRHFKRKVLNILFEPVEPQQKLHID